MKTVAHFDLDKTLVRGNCSYLFGRYLHRNGHLPPFSALFCVGCYALHKTGLLSLEKLHLHIFRKIFLGKSAQRYKELAVQFFDQACPGVIYEPAFNRLLEAKQNGHYTAILSSSPDFMVAHFAKKFQVDFHTGTPYLIDEKGLFHSVGHVVNGDLKKKIAEEIARKQAIPLEKHHFYTDSILDLPLMQSVGKPVAVNPDKQLRMLSQSQQWEIL